jgi:hypothetical protein
VAEPPPRRLREAPEIGFGKGREAIGDGEEIGFDGAGATVGEETVGNEARSGECSGTRKRPEDSVAHEARSEWI